MVTKFISITTANEEYTSSTVTTSCSSIYMPYANLGFGVTSDGGNVTDLNNSSEKTSPRK